MSSQDLLDIFGSDNPTTATQDQIDTDVVDSIGSATKEDNPAGQDSLAPTLKDSLESSLFDVNDTGNAVVQTEYLVPQLVADHTKEPIVSDGHTNVDDILGNFHPVDSIQTKANNCNVDLLGGFTPMVVNSGNLLVDSGSSDLGGLNFTSDDSFRSNDVNSASIVSHELGLDDIDEIGMSTNLQEFSNSAAVLTESSTLMNELLLPTTDNSTLSNELSESQSEKVNDLSSNFQSIGAKLLDINLTSEMSGNTVSMAEMNGPDANPDSGIVLFENSDEDSKSCVPEHDQAEDIDAFDLGTSELQNRDLLALGPGEMKETQNSGKQGELSDVNALITTSGDIFANSDFLQSQTQCHAVVSAKGAQLLTPTLTSTDDKTIVASVPLHTDTEALVSETNKNLVTEVENEQDTTDELTRTGAETFLEFDRLQSCNSKLMDDVIQESLSVTNNNINPVEEPSGLGIGKQTVPNKEQQNDDVHLLIDEDFSTQSNENLLSNFGATPVQMTSTTGNHSVNELEYSNEHDQSVLIESLSSNMTLVSMNEPEKDHSHEKNLGLEEFCNVRIPNQDNVYTSQVTSLRSQISDSEQDTFLNLLPNPQIDNATVSENLSVTCSKQKPEKYLLFEDGTSLNTFKESDRTEGTLDNFNDTSSCIEKDSVIVLPFQEAISKHTINEGDNGLRLTETATENVGIENMSDSFDENEVSNVVDELLQRVYQGAAKELGVCDGGEVIVVETEWCESQEDNHHDEKIWTDSEGDPLPSNECLSKTNDIQYQEKICSPTVVPELLPDESSEYSNVDKLPDDIGDHSGDAMLTVDDRYNSSGTSDAEEDSRKVAYISLSKQNLTNTGQTEIDTDECEIQLPDVSEEKITAPDILISTNCLVKTEGIEVSKESDLINVMQENKSHNSNKSDNFIENEKFPSTEENGNQICLHLNMTCPSEHHSPLQDKLIIPDLILEANKSDDTTQNHSLDGQSNLPGETTEQEAIENTGLLNFDNDQLVGDHSEMSNKAELVSSANDTSSCIPTEQQERDKAPFVETNSAIIDIPQGVSFDFDKSIIQGDNQTAISGIPSVCVITEELCDEHNDNSDIFNGAVVHGLVGRLVDEIICNAVAIVGEDFKPEADECFPGPQIQEKDVYDQGDIMLKVEVPDSEILELPTADNHLEMSNKAELVSSANDTSSSIPTEEQERDKDHFVDFDETNSPISDFPRCVSFDSDEFVIQGDNQTAISGIPSVCVITEELCDGHNANSDIFNGPVVHGLVGRLVDEIICNAVAIVGEDFKPEADDCPSCSQIQGENTYDQGDIMLKVDIPDREILELPTADNITEANDGCTDKNDMNGPYENEKELVPKAPTRKKKKKTLCNDSNKTVSFALPVENVNDTATVDPSSHCIKTDSSYNEEHELDHNMSDMLGGPVAAGLVGRFVDEIIYNSVTIVRDELPKETDECIADFQLQTGNEYAHDIDLLYQETKGEATASVLDSEFERNGLHSNKQAAVIEASVEMSVEEPNQSLGDQPTPTIPARRKKKKALKGEIPTFQNEETTANSKFEDLMPSSVQSNSEVLGPAIPTMVVLSSTQSDEDTLKNSFSKPEKLDHYETSENTPVFTSDTTSGLLNINLITSSQTDLISEDTSDNTEATQVDDGSDKYDDDSEKFHSQDTTIGQLHQAANENLLIKGKSDYDIHPEMCNFDDYDMDKSYQQPTLPNADIESHFCENSASNNDQQLSADTELNMDVHDISTNLLMIDVSHSTAVNEEISTSFINNALDEVSNTGIMNGASHSVSDNIPGVDDHNELIATSSQIESIIDVSEPQSSSCVLTQTNTGNLGTLEASCEPDIDKNILKLSDDSGFVNSGESSYKSHETVILGHDEPRTSDDSVGKFNDVEETEETAFMSSQYQQLSPPPLPEADYDYVDAVEIPRSKSAVTVGSDYCDDESGFPTDVLQNTGTTESSTGVSIPSSFMKKSVSLPARYYNNYSSAMPSTVFIDKDLLSDNESDGESKSTSSNEETIIDSNDSLFSDPDAYDDPLDQYKTTYMYYGTSQNRVNAPSFPQFDPQIPSTYEAYDTDWEDIVTEPLCKFSGLPIILEESESSDIDETEEAVDMDQSQEIICSDIRCETPTTDDEPNREIVAGGDHIQEIETVRLSDRNTIMQENEEGSSGNASESSKPVKHENDVPGADLCEAPYIIVDEYKADDIHVKEVETLHDIIVNDSEYAELSGEIDRGEVESKKTETESTHQVTENSNSEITVCEDEHIDTGAGNVTQQTDENNGNIKYEDSLDSDDCQTKAPCDTIVDSPSLQNENSSERTCDNSDTDITLNVSLLENEDELESQSNTLKMATPEIITEHAHIIGEEGTRQYMINISEQENREHDNKLLNNGSTIVSLEVNEPQKPENDSSNAELIGNSATTTDNSSSITEEILIASQISTTKSTSEADECGQTMDFTKLLENTESKQEYKCEILTSVHERNNTVPLKLITSTDGDELNAVYATKEENKSDDKLNNGKSQFVTPSELIICQSNTEGDSFSAETINEVGEILTAPLLVDQEESESTNGSFYDPITGSIMEENNIQEKEATSQPVLDVKEQVSSTEDELTTVTSELNRPVKHSYNSSQSDMDEKSTTSVDQGKTDDTSTIVDERLTVTEIDPTKDTANADEIDRKIELNNPANSKAELTLLEESGGEICIPFHEDNHDQASTQDVSSSAKAYENSDSIITQKLPLLNEEVLEAERLSFIQSTPEIISKDDYTNAEEVTVMQINAEFHPKVSSTEDESQEDLFMQKSTTVEDEKKMDDTNTNVGEILGIRGTNATEFVQADEVDKQIDEMKPDTGRESKQQITGNYDDEIPISIHKDKHEVMTKEFSSSENTELNAVNVIPKYDGDDKSQNVQYTKECPSSSTTKIIIDDPDTPMKTYDSDGSGTPHVPFLVTEDPIKFESLYTGEPSHDYQADITSICPLSENNMPSGNIKSAATEDHNSNDKVGNETMSPNLFPKDAVHDQILPDNASHEETPYTDSLHQSPQLSDVIQLQPVSHVGMVVEGNTLQESDLSLVTLEVYNPTDENNDATTTATSQNIDDRMKQKVMQSENPCSTADETPPPPPLRNKKKSKKLQPASDGNDLSKQAKAGQTTEEILVIDNVDSTRASDIPAGESQILLSSINNGKPSDEQENSSIIHDSLATKQAAEVDAVIFRSTVDEIVVQEHPVSAVIMTTDQTKEMGANPEILVRDQYMSADTFHDPGMLQTTEMMPESETSNHVHTAEILPLVASVTPSIPSLSSDTIMEEDSETKQREVVSLQDVSKLSSLSDRLEDSNDKGLERDTDYATSNPVACKQTVILDTKLLSENMTQELTNLVENEVLEEDKELPLLPTFSAADNISTDSSTEEYSSSENEYIFGDDVNAAELSGLQSYEVIADALVSSIMVDLSTSVEAAKDAISKRYDELLRAEPDEISDLANHDNTETIEKLLQSESSIESHSSSRDETASEDYTQAIKLVEFSVIEEENVEISKEISEISDEDNETSQLERKERRQRFDTTGSIRYLTDSEEEDAVTKESEKSSRLISLDDDIFVEDSADSTPSASQDSDEGNRLFTKRKSLVPPSSLVLSIALDEIDLREKSDIQETPVSQRISLSSSLTSSQTSLTSSGGGEAPGNKRNLLPRLPSLRSKKPSQPVVQEMVKTKYHHVNPEDIIPIVPMPDLKRVVKWENVTIRNIEYQIDEAVVQPYKKSISHGGFYNQKSAIIEIFVPYLPAANVQHYDWIMDNLFLYVLATVELLAQDKFSVVIFVGSKSNLPANALLRRWHEHVDYRLKKNVEAFYIVNSTFYFRTMARLFVSRKVNKKMKYIKSMAELATYIPTDFLFVPPEIAT